MPPDTTQQLAALLRRERVLDMPALQLAFPHRSRRSIIRDLVAVGYRTSCNFSGGFYTLADTPEFDADGLWRHGQVLFSREGTLKATVRQLVHAAESGQTHRELQQRLQIRVHNTLRELVGAQEIAREIVEKLFLYVSTDPGVRSDQLEHRRALLQQAEGHPPLEPYEIIEVLLAVIRCGVLVPGRVFAHLRAEGHAISAAQVQRVFAQYELPGKKNCPSPP